MTSLNRWPRPWGAPRRAMLQLALPPRPRPGPIARDEALDLAARLVATAIVRGYDGARELSDLFAAAKIPLPLVNWPPALLDPLEVAATRPILARVGQLGRPSGLAGQPA